jgi:hypothetical protein
LPPNPGLIEQVIADTNNSAFSIVDNEVFKFDPNTLTWSSTSYAGGGRGTPKHIALDARRNLYAVNGVPDIWVRSASTQTWGSSSLHFPTATAGIIYQDLVFDAFNNVYARTQNGSANSVWQFQASTQTWRNLATIPGFPTTAVINRLTSDDVNDIYLATSQGLFVFSGFSWFRMDSEDITDFLSNFVDAFYIVTRNHGVKEGTVTT